MEDNFDFDFGEESLEQLIDDGASAPAEFDDSDVNYTETDYNEDDNEDSKDYISRLLESRGIDRNRIQILDEEGNPSEVSFDSLSEQDKFDILNYQEDPVLPEDHEIQTINFLRQNNMTLQEFAEWQRQEAIKEYLAGQSPVSETDSYSDEEIVAYDYIKRFGESMSDEEIDAEIERLKADPEAFEKRVSLLRNAFKAEEEAQARLYQDQENARNAENENMFIQTYHQALAGIDNIQNVELDDNDRDELLRFVLEKDQANRTGLSKAMDNPENVLKMAWYLLHGDYFQKEISKRSKPAPRVVTKAGGGSKRTVSREDEFVF